MLTLLCLCARSVDWTIGESLALLETWSDLDSVNSAGLLVFVPSGPGDISTDDGFDGENAELAHLHATVLKDGTQGLGDLRRKVESNEVCAEGGDGFLQSVEPCASAESEKNSLVGNAL